MEELQIRLSKKVTTTIFEIPEIREKLSGLFEELEACFVNRFEKLKAFALTSKRGESVLKECENISYNRVRELFEESCHEQVLNDAVMYCVEHENGWDLKNSVLAVLSGEKMADAIFGNPMVEAFNDAIRELEVPEDASIADVIKDATIFRIKREFLITL